MGKLHKNFFDSKYLLVSIIISRVQIKYIVGFCMKKLFRESGSLMKTSNLESFEEVDNTRDPFKFNKLYS